jgi:glycosyltransferase involved in cell wall biosynthesis
MSEGVSVVICCHNGARRLPQTLAHLAAQQVEPWVAWEVIVVDNASTDGTGQVALTSWPADAPAPLQVVNEPRIGLSFARWRGFQEARYAVISFVDDDNWVCPEWVQLVSEIMRQHPNVGACGGYIEAVCEITPPWWFERYKRRYCIGPQGQAAGDITSTRGYLWGAGLSVRKTAWQQSVSKGFQSLLIGRQGKALSSGEDAELCLALRLAGWRMWYEPRLTLHHFLPARRLEWKYLRALHRGFGASSVIPDLYYFALRGNSKTSIEWVKRTWFWQIIVVLIKLLWYGSKLPLSFYHSLEGNSDLLQLEYRLGRLSELLQRSKIYRLSVQELWTIGIS